MSPGEVLYRSGHRLRSLVLRAGHRSLNAEPAIQPEDWPRAWLVPVTGLEVGKYVGAADAIMGGQYSFFDLDAVQLGRPPDWNRDPLTGRTAPLRRASKLDHRDQALVGNIKYLWEPNRHLHLVTLAQAYALTKDRRYADEVGFQLQSWFEQCPYCLGANWTSSLELGIRLINWSLAWQLLGGASSPLFEDEAGCSFRDAWLDSVFLHSRHIMDNLSRYSSANNHLIGEASGVFVASTTWPCWPSLARDRERCREILIREAELQNAPDGGNREQAIAYQQFVLDFLLLAGLTARSTGEDFPDAFWDRLEAMTGFLAAMMDYAGHLPMIGDADDGFVVRLSPQATDCPYRSLVATGALVFDRSDLAAKAGHLDDKTRWLLGTQPVDARFAALASDGRERRRFPRAFEESGYYILGQGFDTPSEIRMLVDAGPLGYLSIAAHGHADALAVVLSIGGHEVLIDPGTYCYHTLPEWRAYFRGTAAHNTVEVDGKDQSMQRGNFMWSDHARATLVEFHTDAASQRLVVEHDGYLRFRDPVRHRREIVFDAASREFEICDILECAGTHSVIRNWHLAENLEPTCDSDTFSVRTPTATVTLSPLEPLQAADVIYGSDRAKGGWISRRFGRKVPTHSIRWHNQISGTAVLRTRIACELD